ncbi:MAG TPA: hypothetical protein VHX39_01090 [Acetobacteraceae bacterium]|nr:hypothetical protein [Acetobacteraceae bacterium]
MKPADLLRKSCRFRPTRSLVTRPGPVRTLIVVFAAVALSGCGVRVPDLEEIPNGPGSAQSFEQIIVHSIQCSIKDAVDYVKDQDIKLAPLNNIDRTRTPFWFDTWGIQATLTLAVAEKTDVNPSTTWIPSPVKALFSLAAGVDVSSQATRTDTLNFYYNVTDIYKERACASPTVITEPTGSLLVNNNLKFREFLVDQIFNVGTGELTSIQKNGLTHDVKFEVVSSATLSPSWKTRYWTINPTGSLLTANRDRTHEISVTFGPSDPEQKMLVGPAAGQVIASQLATAISARINP